MVVCHSMPIIAPLMPTVWSANANHFPVMPNVSVPMPMPMPTCEMGKSEPFAFDDSDEFCELSAAVPGVVAE